MLNNLNDALRNKENNDGYLIGTVQNIDDPEKQGRIQCTVPGMFELSGMPWCVPMVESPFGAGPGYGVFGVPQVGSKVSIELQDGDAHKPVYSRGWRGANDTPTEFEDPTVWGFKDTNSNTLIVDGTNITFTSGLGVTLNIQGTDLNVTAPGSINATAINGINLNAAGTVNVRATGSVNLQSTGPINAGGSVVNVVGSVQANVNAPIVQSICTTLTAEVAGVASITAASALITTSGAATVTAGGAVSITGSTITITGTGSVTVQAGGVLNLLGTSINFG